MRSHRRRAPLDHVLIAGGIEDSASIGTVLALLPETAFGQVFLEVPSELPMPELHAPGRVSVHRLDRTVPGERLGRALEAWMGEWSPTEPDAGREVTIWVGECVTAGADLAWHELGTLVERL